MKLSTFTFLAFYLNGAAGTGKYADITIALVKQNIRTGKIFEFLKQKLGDDIDLSVLSADDRETLLEQWRDLIDLDEARKLCVEHGGLNLLVAYLLDGINKLSSV